MGSGAKWGLEGDALPFADSGLIDGSENGVPNPMFTKRA